MANHHGAHDLKLAAQPHDIIGEPTHRVTLMRRTTLPVPPEVDRHNAMATCEVAHLRGPEPPMAGKAVHEHQRLISATDVVKRKRDSIAHEQRHRASLHDLHSASLPEDSELQVAEALTGHAAKREFARDPRPYIAAISFARFDAPHPLRGSRRDLRNPRMFSQKLIARESIPRTLSSQVGPFRVAWSVLRPGGEPTEVSSRCREIDLPLALVALEKNVSSWTGSAVSRIEFSTRKSVMPLFS